MSRGVCGGLAIAIVATSFAYHSSAFAQAENPVYPPGLESQVGALVFRGDGEPLGPRVEVGDARIEGDRIEVELRDGEATVGLVWLTHHDARMQATEVGATPSFTVWLADGAGRPGVSEAAAALRARVASRDDGSLRGVAGTPTATGIRSAPRTLSVSPWRRGALWLSLLGLFVFLAIRERKLFLPAALAERVALLALVALAIALRLGLPSWAPLHANEHGIAELRALSGADLDPHSLGGLLFGGAYLDLVRALLAPFGVAPDLVLALGALFSGLAVLLLHRVVAQLVRGPWGPALAALGLALHPTHVRLSLSESPRPLAGALLLLGILCGLCARKATSSATRAAAIVAASIAWSLAAELRVITVVLPVVGLAFVILAGRTEGRAQKVEGSRRAAVPVGVAILFGTLASHLSVLGAALADGASRPPVDWLHRATESNVLFDPELSALTLVPFALAGAALLFWAGERRVAIACALAVALLTPPSLFVCACRTDAIRYQSEAHLFLFVASAGLAPTRWALASRLGASWIPANLVAVASSLRARLWLAVPVGLVAASLPGLLALTRPDLQERAYQMARQRAPGPPVVIVVPPREMRGDRRVRSDFPDYAISSGAGSSPGRTVDALPENRDACAVWIGPACWSFTDDEVRSGAAERQRDFRDECRELLGGGEATRAALSQLTPVAVPHRDREFQRIPAEHPRLGFAPCAPHSSQR
jgi:hypothetical protein